jgi:DNA-binding CsgD family transcriptional regulator
VTRRLLAAYATRRPQDRERLQLSAHLTEREADILNALAEGLCNAEIAQRLWLSAETVKTHVKSILLKLAVRNLTQAVVWAYRAGFVDPSSGQPPSPAGWRINSAHYPVGRRHPTVEAAFPPPGGADPRADSRVARGAGLVSRWCRQARVHACWIQPPQSVDPGQVVHEDVGRVGGQGVARLCIPRH